MDSPHKLQSKGFPESLQPVPPQAASTSVAPDEREADTADRQVLHTGLFPGTSPYEQVHMLASAVSLRIRQPFYVSKG